MEKRIGDTKENVLGAPLDAMSIDDEISLVDLWRTIRRRWLWLLAGMIVGLSCAVAYVALTVTTYESRATLRIGNVRSHAPGSGGDVIVEDLGVLSIELFDRYGPQATDGVRRRLPHLKRDPGAKNNMLELAVIGRSPEEARDFLAQIAAKVVQRHEELYMNATGLLRRRLTSIDAQIKSLTAQLNEFDELVARLKESNPAQASVVAIERGNVLENIDYMERERILLQQQTTKPYVNPTEVLAGPDMPERPASPRTRIAVISGLVFGVALGLIFIFLARLVEKGNAVSGPSKRGGR